ncbi:MAG: ECF transporter S component [Oscillospiraceae bacterium]|nr:ECF transporter S component [Oscillospiraceae bacterium]
MSKTTKKTRKLTTMAMLVAVSVILIYAIHFPIFPAAPFLEYDPADIPILIGAFLFGPISGLAITVVASVIQGITVSASSQFIGIIMHIISTGSMVLVAGGIYRKFHSRKGAAIALVAGVITMTAAMSVCNLIFTPIFMGAPREAVLQMLVPIIIPFNLLKSGINSIITFFVYKSISRLVTGEEKE